MQATRRVGPSGVESGEAQDADVVAVRLGIADGRETVRARGMSALALRLLVDALDAVHLRVDVDIGEAVLVVPVEVLLVPAVHAEVVVDGVVRRAVVVVEARDRVGGRTLTERYGDTTFDLGAQWIGPAQNRMARLCEQFGVSTLATHHAGRKVLDIAGKLSQYKSDIPSLPPFALLQLHRTMKAIERTTASAPTPGGVAMATISS